MILPDSSAWIEMFRATGHPVERLLARLIEEDVDLALTEPVVMEVLAGTSPPLVEPTRAALFAFPLLRVNGMDDYEAGIPACGSSRRGSLAGMEFVERFAQELTKASGSGITVSREEIVAVLALAREVAHRTDDRTNAPVAAYLAGKFAAGRDGEGALSDATAMAEGLLPPA